jgi:predicted HicB family RNase H-like nuclease
MPKKGTVRMKKAKGETVHISANVAPELTKAARIQAIAEGVSLRDWIGQAIIMRLEKKPQGQGADAEEVRHE